MPIRAYVWKPSGGNVGHASLELSDGTYISWWPEKDWKKSGSLVKKTPDVCGTLQSDVSKEGKQPDCTFVLPEDLGLNEASMKSWWENIKPDEMYNVLGNNCCGAVKEALAAGGLSVEKRPIETPNGMIEYMEYLVEQGTSATSRKKKTYNPI